MSRFGRKLRPSMEAISIFAFPVHIFLALSLSIRIRIASAFDVLDRTPCVRLSVGLPIISNRLIVCWSASPLDTINGRIESV